jgi:hypothetical protein
MERGKTMKPGVGCERGFGSACAHGFVRTITSCAPTQVSEVPDHKPGTGSCASVSPTLLANPSMALLLYAETASGS